MSKRVVGVAAGVLVIAAGVTGAAYWSGLQAERWYEEALAESAKSGNVKLSTVRYQRGVFSSHILTRVEITEPEVSDANDPSFSIRQEVYHGPLPLAGWGEPDVPMALTSAVVRATLDTESSQWTRQLAQWYGHQEPVTAVSQIAFNGASTTQITMPALALNDVENLQRLDYSGLQGQFRVGPKNAAIQGHLTIANLHAVGKPEAASEGPPAASGGLVHLRDLKLNVDQRKGPFNLLFGESSFTIAELRAQDQTSKAPLVMTGLSMTGSLTAQSPQQVIGEARIKADQVTVDRQSGTGSLHLALRNLDGATVEKLQQWQQKVSRQPDDPQAVNELLALMKTLLAGNPEFMLDTQGTMTVGDWRGKLTLNFRDFNAPHVLQDPSSLLDALEKGVADVAASRTLVETVLTDQIVDELQAQTEEQEQPVDPQALRGMAATQAQQQLQQWLTAGFIKRDGERYTTTARFTDGKLWVNDQEIPLASPVDSDQDAMEEALPMTPDEELLIEPESEAEQPAQQ
ncbi:MAG: YdgA family protein [Candidatus Competibacteraceae bacterium]